MEIRYKELSRADWESLALIITENGHAEDIELDFISLEDGTAELMIRIIPEIQQRKEPMAYVAYDIETERFIHKGVTLQRLIRDGLWYAIYNNSIIKIDQYRNDLIAWIDEASKSNYQL